MRRLVLALGPVMLAGLAYPALAQDSDPATAQGDVAVTIYNNGQSLVQDARQLSVTRGRNRIEFPDVSARIRPETVTLSGTGLSIVEQNFDFDLLTPDKLMDKAVGQSVTLVRTNPATGAEKSERAKVLAANGGIVLQIGDRIEVLRDDGLPVRTVFDRLPPNLRARPTLSVTVDAAEAGAVPARLSYLTPNLGWTADYVALFDAAKGAMDLQGWVTLTNTTGTTFTNARTLLVAGNPNGGGGGFTRLAGTMDSAGTESNDRERLGDYYLYPLPARTTIANAQQKQVSFLDVKGRRRNRPMSSPIAGSAAATIRSARRACCAFRPRARAGSATSCPPERSASTCATRAAIRNSSAKIASTIPRWVRRCRCALAMRSM